MILAPKLKIGDEIRVIAPARQLNIVSDQVIEIASNRLSEMGYKVSFGKNVRSDDFLVSTDVEKRINDLHDAFKDKNVKAIITAIGGFNSNELLKYIDYELIKNNPKIIVGYSDITALQNAIFSQTGLVTYSGPHFSSFGEQSNFEYSKDYFSKAVIRDEFYAIHPSEKWSADKWYKNQIDRNLIVNKGYKIINKGTARGTIVGGNLCTFNLLQGTRFMPKLKDTVLFLEDDQMGLMHIGLFIRNIVSLIQQPEFSGVNAIIFGRFHPDCDIDDERLKKIVHSIPELSSRPIVSGVDFGHTDPRITFPIGGTININAHNNVDLLIEIQDH